MKKIGILTLSYPENHNFGAMIQSYAIEKMYSKLGLNAQLINYKPFRDNKNLKLKLIEYLIGGDFYRFKKIFLNLSPRVENIVKLERLNNEFDYFSVGSDQVWRPIWFKNHQKHYFLDFVKEDKKKIAYAASFGVDYWECDKVKSEEYKRLLQRFDFVSTREDSGVKLCREEFNVEATSVLDPTIMIEKKEYDKILDDYKCKKHLEKEYIAHMLLDDNEELTKESQLIASHLECEINKIKGREVKIFGRNFFKYNKVSQWLTYLRDSKLIITDSFHCVIFALIFEKEFVVVTNPKRGVARLENILCKVGLDNRFFTNIKDVLESGILDKKIDYKEVNKKIDVYRKKSFEFLEKAVGEKG